MAKDVVKTEIFEYPSSESGQSIKAYLYIPENPEYKGIVHISHGMNEHMGRYSELTAFLCQKGFIVCGNDHLGHGDSYNKIKGYFGEKGGGNTLVQDMHKVYVHVSGIFPELPYFLLGHSMGSFITRKYMETYSMNLNGVMLSGTGNMDFPLNFIYGVGLIISRIMIKLKGPTARAKSLQRLSLEIFRWHFRPMHTAADWQTRDKKKAEEFLNDKKCRFTFTYGGYRDLLLLIKDVSNKGKIFKNKKLPVFLFSGDNDPVGLYGRAMANIVNDFREAGLENVTMKLYAGGRHEMLNEINRVEVFQDVLKFLEKNLKK